MTARQLELSRSSTGVELSRPSTEPLSNRDMAVSIGVLLLAIVVLGTIGVLLGPDGNYDLRNYHYYAGWALLHKRVGYDLGPAQLQTYQHPLMDAVFYVVAHALNDYPRVFTFVWGVPQAVAVWLTFLVARLCFESAGRGRDVLAFLAAAIGAGGATSIGVIGTSMSEGLANACAVGSMLAALVALRRARGVPPLMFLAGFLIGTAAVLKLTMASYLVAFWGAMVLVPLAQRRLPGLTTLLVGGFGTALALIALGGPWWWVVYRTFESPLFPYFNAIFESPYYAPHYSFFDDRFLPKTLYEWIFYPLEWTLRKTRRVAEYPVRDVRIALAVVAGLGVTVAGVVRGMRAAPTRIDASLWCAIFFLIGYVVWLVQFSILRYASGLETICGVVIVAAISALFGTARPVWPQAVAALAVAIGLVATTVYPIWDRRQRDPGPKFIGVEMPTLSKDSTVILLVPTPASYLAAFQDPAVRFIGVNNVLLRLDRENALQELVQKTIAQAPGPIWGIDKTDDFIGLAEPALQRYHLRRTADCSPILSTVDNNLRICRLEHAPKSDG